MAAGLTRSGPAALTMAGLLLLVAGCGKDEFEVSPCETSGSQLIAFASDRNQSAGQFEVYLFDLQGGGYHLLRDLNSPAAADSSPALSTDGRFIAFVSDRAATGADLYLYDRASCSLVPLPGVNSGARESEPVFSHDTRLIAFSRDTLGFSRVRMVSGTGFTPAYVPLPGLEAPGANDWSPALDRTGALVAFISDRSGNPDVLVYDAAGDSLLALPGLNTAAAELDPALSSSGRWLCVASDRAGGAGGFDLYLYDLTADSLVAALPGLNGARDERRPSMSGNGDVIAFQSDRGDTTSGWDVLYWFRNGGVLASPAALRSSAQDLHPSLVLK